MQLQPTMDKAGGRRRGRRRTVRGAGCQGKAGRGAVTQLWRWWDFRPNRMTMMTMTRRCRRRRQQRLLARKAWNKMRRSIQWRMMQCVVVIACCLPSVLCSICLSACLPACCFPLRQRLWLYVIIRFAGLRQFSDYPSIIIIIRLRWRRHSSSHHCSRSAVGHIARGEMRMENSFGSSSSSDSCDYNLPVYVL